MLRSVRCIFLAAFLCLGLGFAPISLAAPENISLRRISENLLVAPVTINGEGPFDFVIDTGTNTTLIDPALAAQLALPLQGAESLRTLTGPVRALRYRLAAVAVGSAVVREASALAQPMTALQRMDRRVQGILGLGFLGQFSFLLDYAHLRMRLDDGSKSFKISSNVSTAASVSARIVHDRLVVSVASSLAPRGSWNLALDSGTSQILIFADRIVLPESVCFAAPTTDPICRARAPSVFTRITTNRSERFGRAIELDRISIGGFQLPSVPAVVLNGQDSTADAAEDGLLPVCLFRAILFDRAASTIFLNPN